MQTNKDIWIEKLEREFESLQDHNLSLTIGVSRTLASGMPHIQYMSEKVHAMKKDLSRLEELLGGIK